MASLEPRTIYAGTRVEWTSNLGDYTLGNGYGYTYDFRSAADAFRFSGSPTAGNTLEITLLAATTAAYTADTYNWYLFATLAGERYFVRTGIMVVKPDIVAVSASDQRTDAQINMEAIMVLIKGESSQNVAAYSISGRNITKESKESLRREWRAWKNIWDAEQDQINREMGCDSRYLIKVHQY